MKKLLFLLGLIFFIGVLPTKAYKAPTSNQVTCIMQQSQPDVSIVELDAFELPTALIFQSIYNVGAGVNAAVLIQELIPPNAGYSDVLEIPDKDDDPSNWFYWAASLIVVLLYEIVFRLVPTSKSVSIITLLYNILNLFLKDRADSGGVFKIQKE